MKRAMALLISLLLFPALAWSAERERIIDFSSHISVHADSTMNVVETITVYAKGNRIKRGIYRDFPTTYKDRLGNRIEVDFKILDVLKDGMPEPYHRERLSNGIRIYMGEKNTYLRPGIYKYSLSYSTNRQLGYFKDFDELYWNVTGNGWDFMIEKAKALVILPEGATVIGAEAYTGGHGEKGEMYAYDYDMNGNIYFTTTAMLKSKEGLTIAVAWPKGFVKEPSLMDRGAYLLNDNRNLSVPLAGFIVLMIYYFLAWLMAGRDPRKGTIIPQFYPPRRFTPASTRFVMNMGFNDKAFTAAIINMAVKGALKIREEEKGHYTLVRCDDNDLSALSKGERKACHELFQGGGELVIKQVNHVRIGKAMDALKKSLKGEFERVFFVTNKGYFIPGLLITFVTMGAMLANANELGGAIFITIWLSGWTLGCLGLIINALKSWRDALSSSGYFGTAVVATAFAVPFIGFEIFGIYAFNQFISGLSVPLFFAVITVNFLFYHLLKAPTRYGRKTMDLIEGFKLYLSVAEKERLNMLNPPERTPELFEKYLPYALALDVEQQWCEQFARLLQKASREDNYHTRWYDGTHTDIRDMNNFASDLGGAFTGAISSASTAPGSSSGSGGGGSSGGGGGGGGGGGW